MITKIRMASQQLVHPQFSSPKDLVAYMGAMQAQEYTMAKWAVGIRLKSATLRMVEDAIAKGEILRTHVMRPTWHFVAAEDIRWMLRLSSERIRRAYNSYISGRKLEISEEHSILASDLIVKSLEGGKSLTKKEIEQVLSQAGILTDDTRIRRFLAFAEIEGIVCSGPDKGKEVTYALLDERVPATPELTKEESLAKIARAYFRSHSPASLNDFVWWSGLSVTEARQAVALIEGELLTDRFQAEKLFVHETWGTVRSAKNVLHLLPSYDEFLISYKDRTAVLASEHHPKAFNSWGIFYPVILHNGRITGNWKKSSAKKGVDVSCSFFDGYTCEDEALLAGAIERYRKFVHARIC